MKSFWNPPNLTFARLDILAWSVLSFLLLTHNFICESHHQSLQDNLCWAFPDTKPPSVISNSQQLLSLFLPSLFMIALEKNPPLKKLWKLRTAEQPVATKRHYPVINPSSYSWVLARQGLNSLFSKGWFQLTCCECPKWVTTVNSISTICCPLGHFWTAAWLQCLLLTGNKAWCDSVSEGNRGEGKRRRGKERKHICLLSQKTDNSVFSHWLWWKQILEKKY